MNLIEGIQTETNRAREILKQYESIPEGIFGASMIKRSISYAEKAIASGDVVEMLRAYKDLQEIQ